MRSLISCPNCGVEYSERKARCPGCGTINPKPAGVEWSLEKWIWVTVFALFGVLSGVTGIAMVVTLPFAFANGGIFYPTMGLFLLIFATFVFWKAFISTSWLARVEAKSRSTESDTKQSSPCSFCHADVPFSADYCPSCGTRNGEKGWYTSVVWVSVSFALCGLPGGVIAACSAWTTAQPDQLNRHVTSLGVWIGITVAAPFVAALMHMLTRRR